MNMSDQAAVLYRNGRIFTSNPRQPYASAMVIRNGAIEWIGEWEDSREWGGEKIDLQDKRVLPGLIDAHMHPLFLAQIAKQIPCTPPKLHSIHELIEQIRIQAQTQAPGTWIECWGYDEGKLAEGRAPSRWDLDEATSEIPVVVTRSCGHIVAVNSRALSLAGITKDTPDPEGGHIERDENGEPTGILQENARELVKALMPIRSLQENAALLAELSPKLLAYGITAIAELMAKRHPIDYLEMYQKARRLGMQQRAVLSYEWEDLEQQPFLTSELTCTENVIHIGGIKLFADGSVSGQTAWVQPAFLGGTENHGIPMTSQEELLSAAEMAKEQGIQLIVHAMGEQAIDLIVDTFYKKADWLADAPSVRIEHASLPTKRAIQRAAESGIAFVTQPIFLYAEIESYLKNIGEQRTRDSYPILEMLEAGVPLAFSSDAPATAWADPANPFVGIKSAVTRLAYDGTDTGQAHRVDVKTAIGLYTREAQHVTRIPNIGQLAVGYQADFIVLDQDILEIEPARIDEITVEQTYIGGELVFEKGKEPRMDKVKTT